jgi:hypothetical protein
MAISDLEAEVQLESEERARKILSTEMEERGRAEVFARGSEETGMLSVTHRRAEAEALVIRCTWSVVALWFALWTKFEHIWEAERLKACGFGTEC